MNNYVRDECENMILIMELTLSCKMKKTKTHYVNRVLM